MKSVSRFRTALVPAAVAALTALAPTGEATAATYVLTHAAACKNYAGVGANDIVHHVDSVKNVGSVPRYVICPVPRSPQPINTNRQFYVDITNQAYTQTSCTVYAVDWRSGHVYSAKSFTIANNTGYIYPGTGIASFAPTEMPYGSHVSVLCYLPANSKGYVRGMWALDY